MSILDINLKAAENKRNGVVTKLGQCRVSFYCRPDIVAREDRYTQALYNFLAKFYVGAEQFLRAIGIKTKGKKQPELDAIAEIYLEPLIEEDYSFEDLQKIVGI